MRFRADAPDVRVARRWVAGVARQAGASSEAERVAALLTTEAVTNAVVHGPPGGRVDLEARVTGHRLHVAVSDESAAAPVLRKPDGTELSGRGVLLIDRLATAWGVDHHGGAKTVWFDIAI